MIIVVVFPAPRSFLVVLAFLVFLVVLVVHVILVLRVVCGVRVVGRLTAGRESTRVGLAGYRAPLPSGGERFLTPITLLRTRIRNGGDRGG